jgi:hypothetical protein
MIILTVLSSLMAHPSHTNGPIASGLTTNDQLSNSADQSLAERGTVDQLPT